MAALHPDAPQLEGTAEIRLEPAPGRASGWFTTRGEGVDTRTSGVYLRADEDEVAVMDGPDDQRRAALIGERLAHWQVIRRTRVASTGRADVAEEVT